MRVYHPANEHTDVLTAKKGFVSLLAAKLHYDKEVRGNKKNLYTYND